MQPIRLRVVGDTSDASRKIADLQAEKDRLEASRAEVKIDAQDKEAVAKIRGIDLRMDRLSEKVAKPSITLRGVDSALLEIARLDVALDKLGRKHETATVGTNRRGGIFGKIAGTFSDLAGGIGGTLKAASGLAPAAGQAASEGGSALAATGPYGIGAAAVAAIASLPFVAQQASGGIVAALGGGLATVGIIAAAKAKKVHADWSSAIKAIGADFKRDTRPLDPILEHVAHVARQAFGRLSGSFHDFYRTIAPSLRSFGDALLRAFDSPQVKGAIRGLGVAFAGLLRALKPTMVMIIKGIASGIREVAVAVAKNPGALAGFVRFLGDIVIGGFKVIAALTRVANWIESNWHRIEPQLVAPFKIGTAIITGMIRVFGDVVTGRWGRIWGDIRQTAGRVWNALHDALRATVGLLEGLWRGLASRMSGGWSRLWHDVTSVLGHGVHDVASWFDRMRHDTASIFDRIRHDIASAWDATWHQTIGRLEAGVRDVSHGWSDLLHLTASAFDRIRHDVAAAWDALWHATVSRVTSGVHSVVNWWDNLRHDTASAFDRIRHDVASAWDTIWHATVGRVTSGVHTVVNWFKRMGNDALTALRHLPGALFKLAKDALSEFWNGAKSVGSRVLNWFKGLGHSILSGIKGIFGIHSPSRAMFEIGRNLVLGLHGGVTSMMDKFLGSVGGALGGGVKRWRGVVLEALRMLHLSPALAPRVLYQMQTESGGNPFAINRSDINAQRGDPSRGLLQTIMATFRAYHVRGTSWNIYNPLANVAAAINYARHRYGPTLMRGGMGMGSGHGYWGGGWVREPVVGIGLRSHEPYSFAEHGDEYVSHHAGGGCVINITVAGDTDPDAAARRIWLKLRTLKRHTRQPLGLA